MTVPPQAHRTGHQQKGFLTVHYLRPGWYGDLLFFYWSIISFPGDSVVKNPPANAGDMGGGVDLLEQEMAFYSCSCPENPMDRGTWQAAVHGSQMKWKCSRSVVSDSL